MRKRGTNDEDKGTGDEEKGKIYSETPKEGRWEGGVGNHVQKYKISLK